jgi:Transglutaminase-like superfamily
VNVRRAWVPPLIVLLLVPSLLAACGSAAPTPDPGRSDPGVSATASVAAGSDGAAVASAMPAPTATEAPVSQAPMDAPTVIDVASREVLRARLGAAGGRASADGLRVTVPDGALAAETTLVATRLDAPFRMNPYAPPEPGSVSAVAIGPAFDLGPAGTTFTRPVEVALAYDPASVPPGTDPSALAVAYFTGDHWAVAGGIADPVAHTVSVRLASFEGTVLGAVALALAVGVPLYVGIRWAYGGEGVDSDPISERQAAGWITPDDPVVGDAATTATVGDIPLDDPAKLASYLRGHADTAQPVSLAGPDGAPITLQGRYSAAAGTNWQTPSAYLTTGAMRGDCTDVTNALVSIFRSLGYPAKGVFGYVGDKDTPHVWGEVRIGSDPYLIDEDGRLWPLERGMKDLGFIRADPDDARASMWDENGQAPYEADWWTKAPTLQVGRFDLASMVGKGVDLGRLADLVAGNDVRIAYDKGDGAATTRATVTGTFDFILVLDDAFMWSVHSAVGQGAFGVDPEPMPAAWRGCSVTTQIRGTLDGAQTGPGKTSFKGTASVDVSSDVQGCEKTGENITASPPQSFAKVPWTGTGGEAGIKGTIRLPDADGGSAPTPWIFLTKAP